MHLIRFFLVILLSIALPFTNVAAAAMVHCAQSTSAAQEIIMADAHDVGMHAHHHAQPDAADHHQHHAAGKPGKSHDGCSQCSYCQSCASAYFPAADNRMPAFSASDAKHDLIAGLVPQPSLDQLFRPPRAAFA